MVLLAGDSRQRGAGGEDRRHQGDSRDPRSSGTPPPPPHTASGPEQCTMHVLCAVCVAPCPTGPRCSCSSACIASIAGQRCCVVPPWPVAHCQVARGGCLCMAAHTPQQRLTSLAARAPQPAPAESAGSAAPSPLRAAVRDPQLSEGARAGRTASPGAPQAGFRGREPPPLPCAAAHAGGAATRVDWHRSPPAPAQGLPHCRTETVRPGLSGARPEYVPWWRFRTSVGLRGTPRRLRRRRVGCNTHRTVCSAVCRTFSRCWA